MCEVGVMQGRFLHEFVSSRGKHEPSRQRLSAFRHHKDSDCLSVENSDRELQNVVTDSTARGDELDSLLAQHVSEPNSISADQD